MQILLYLFLLSVYKNEIPYPEHASQSMQQQRKLQPLAGAVGEGLKPQPIPVCFGILEERPFHPDG